MQSRTVAIGEASSSTANVSVLTSMRHQRFCGGPSRLRTSKKPTINDTANRMPTAANRRCIVSRDTQKNAALKLLRFQALRKNVSLFVSASSSSSRRLTPHAPDELFPADWPEAHVQRASAAQGAQAQGLLGEEARLCRARARLQAEAREAARAQAPGRAAQRRRVLLCTARLLARTRKKQQTNRLHSRRK